MRSFRRLIAYFFWMRLITLFSLKSYLESGKSIKRSRKSKTSHLHPLRMIKSFGSRLHYHFKLHPFMGFFISLSLGTTILLILSIYESHYRSVDSYGKFDLGSDDYLFPKLQNLIMVAGAVVVGRMRKEDLRFGFKSLVRILGFELENV
ncbi:hypothetical protein K1719_016411 [Acacia pycnantha]|nr:hypothetical protein K1719_016411 [Acacia pycnantha]